MGARSCARWGPRRRVAVAAAAWLVAGCLAWPARDLPLPPVPQIDPQQLERDVRWLAADAREGRGVGTRGLEEAAAYVAEAFRAAGLTPAGDDGGFFQRFEMPVAIRVTHQALRAEGLAFEPERDFQALLSSGNADFEAPLVFAGYGISAPEADYDDYAGLDVEGRAVLVLSDRPGGDASPLGGAHGNAFLSRASKVQTARDRGARAVLIAPVEDEGAAADGDAPVVPPDHWANPTLRESGIAVLTLTRGAAERLVAAAGGPSLVARQRAIDAHARPASQALDVRVGVAVSIERELGATANVVGVREGSDPVLRREAVVVGAHYDHLGSGAFGSLSPDRRGEIHNGADDNASGTAGLLALARAFAAAPPTRRSLVLAAFTGEEAGLVGSSEYVRRPALALEDTVAMLNLDMIGRLHDRQLVVFGAGSSPGFPRLVRRAARELSLRVSLSEDGFAPSDQTSFYAREVPVLGFFTGIHPQYHTPDDDAERIDAAGASRVVALVYRVAHALLDAPERPALVPARAPERSGTGDGYGPYLGTVPDFAGSDGPGVLLQGIAPDSPAERAGLRAGDRIVAFDGASVANLEEYAARLFSARPGREVRIEVVREGERIEVTARLGRRR